MSQYWTMDFSEILAEVSYVYAYWGVPKIVQCVEQGSWAIKIDKIVLDHSNGWWVPADERCIKLESWHFVGNLAQPIKIDVAVMEHVVRWQLDFGERS